MFIILSGYLSWFQTKNQLVSPLIPESLTYQIFSDGGESYFRTSMIAGAVFLIGLLSYSFNKKTIALVIFVITALLFLGLRLL